MKSVLALIGILMAVSILFIIASRNRNYVKHYKMLDNGVDEGTFLTLGGQEQYVLMRGMNTEHPFIIYLHGGPSFPDTYATYGFTDYLIDRCTVVAWDQRGCGRTYFHNLDNDPKNETASFDQALKDLDELVDYAMGRFGQDKVILLGHSTILGSVYVKAHPKKISAYIGAAQVVSLEKTDIYSYEDALSRAKEADDDTVALKNAYEAFQTDGGIVNMMNLRHLTAPYHPVAVSDKAAMMTIQSPYFGVDDFRWFLKQLGSIEQYWILNEQLFEYTFAFYAYEQSLAYKVPVYFLSGSCDWICPVDSIKAYADDILSEDVRVETLEGCGHNLHFSSPQEFAQKIKGLLE